LLSTGDLRPQDFEAIWQNRLTLGVSKFQDSTSTKGTAQGFDQYGFALFPVSLE
jgi:hypothetical protein